MVETRVDESAGWRGMFSLRVWWAHLVWLVLAAAAGGGALYFIYAERWSIDFIKRVMAISPALQALNVAIGMIIICRLRDRVFPGTEGTGIPQAMAALDLGEGAARSRLLSLRIAVGKIVLLTLGLFSGATIGREGPSVHVAACFLYLGRRFATFRPHLIERGLIVAGGAAGIGAAFNAPVAGIIFAFEEIGRGFDKRNSGMVVRTVVVACLVCVAVLSNYRFYGLVDAEFHHWRDWLGMPIAIGLAGGLLGGVFARIVAETTPRVAHLARHRPYAVAGSLGLSLAVLGLISGGASYGGGDQQAHAILIEGQSLPAYYPLVKALGSFITLISSIPGGLFTPSLSVGAGLGQLAADWVPETNRQAIVLLAMAAYFSGVVQSPLTAAVIVIEMTSARLMTLPLLFATVTAYETSRLVCPVSLYEALAQSFVRRLEQPPRVG
ncbi:MAG: chloride channel protein [Candidatus Binatia bacterium]